MRGFWPCRVRLPPPEWFRLSVECMLSGARGRAGRCHPHTSLLGCSLTVRKSALLEPRKNGFRTWVRLQAGNGAHRLRDTELCLALRLAGWRLWYEPRLRLQAFIPAKRLEWSYLRRHYRGAGLSLTSA